MFRPHPGLRRLRWRQLLATVLRAVQRVSVRPDHSLLIDPQPPSTGRAMPMMKLAPGLHSNRTDALAEVADRCRGGGVGRVELALGDHVGDHRSLDSGGADGVNADPARRVLQGGAAALTATAPH